MSTASAVPTHSVRLFLEAANAVRRAVAMSPRSADDKEYFAQDWIIDRLKACKLPYQQEGRNSYPDFWVGDGALIEGYEVKSLAFANGKPARKDYDSNSTIPSGRKNSRDVFLVFFLYTGTKAQARTVHTLSIAHGDLINCDHAVADEHLNQAIPGFGSYAEGFIRNRKMYVFPHPLTIDPTGLGRSRLVVPAAWRVADTGLKKVARLERTVAPDAVSSYTIKMLGKGEAEVHRAPYDNAGIKHLFDVFEPA